MKKPEKGSVERNPGKPRGTPGGQDAEHAEIDAQEGPDAASSARRTPGQGAAGTKPKDDRDELREVQNVRSGPGSGFRSRR